MNWRVLPLTTHDAFTNMATDEAIVESVAEGGQSTIRFYGWQPSAISIGFFQSVWDLDLHRCKQFGIDVVRRQTEGEAIYHEGGISYSVIAPEGMFPKNIGGSYKVICNSIIDSLKILGINGKFNPIGSVTVDGKQISASAQARIKGVLLQHGTMFFNSSKPPFPVKSIEKVTHLTDFGSFNTQTVYHAMVQGFTSGKEFVFGHKTDQEMEKMRRLISTKYSAHEWLTRR